MKADKSANICANIYEGRFQVDFDCVGVTLCRFALCPVMPPDGADACVHARHNACLCSHAKHAALESLRHRLKNELKQLDAAYEEPDGR